MAALNIYYKPHITLKVQRPVYKCPQALVCSLLRSLLLPASGALPPLQSLLPGKPGAGVPSTPRASVLRRVTVPVLASCQGHLQPWVPGTIALRALLELISLGGGSVISLSVQMRKLRHREADSGTCRFISHQATWPLQAARPAPCTTDS